MSEEFEEKLAKVVREYTDSIDIPNEKDCELNMNTLLVRVGYRALLDELCEGLIRKDGRIEVIELVKRVHKVRKKLGLEKGEC